MGAWAYQFDIESEIPSPSYPICLDTVKKNANLTGTKWFAQHCLMVSYDLVLGSGTFHSVTAFTYLR